MARRRRSIYVSHKPVRLDPDYIVKAPMTDEELRQFLAMKKRQRLAFEAKCTRMHNEWIDAGRERNDRMHLVQGYTRYMTVTDCQYRTKYIVLIRAGYSIYDNDYNFQACVDTLDDLHDIFDNRNFRFITQNNKFATETF